MRCAHVASALPAQSPPHVAPPCALRGRQDMAVFSTATGRPGASGRCTHGLCLVGAGEPPDALPRRGLTRGALPPGVAHARWRAAPHTLPPGRSSGRGARASPRAERHGGSHSLPQRRRRRQALCDAVREGGARAPISPGLTAPASACGPHRPDAQAVVSQWAAPGPLWAASWHPGSEWLSLAASALGEACAMGRGR